MGTITLTQTLTLTLTHNPNPNSNPNHNPNPNPNPNLPEVPEILSTPGAPQPVCAASLKLTKPPPDKGLVYDCCYQADRGAWVEWLATVPAYKVPAGAKFTDINVQTADTVQYGT